MNWATFVYEWDNNFGEQRRPTARCNHEIQQIAIYMNISKWNCVQLWETTFRLMRWKKIHDLLSDLRVGALRGAAADSSFAESSRREFVVAVRD